MGELFDRKVMEQLTVGALQRSCRSRGAQEDFLLVSQTETLYNLSAKSRINAPVEFSSIGSADHNYGLWTMDYGLWTMDYGLWTMDYGLWTIGYGVWTVACDTILLCHRPIWTAAPAWISVLVSCAQYSLLCVTCEPPVVCTPWEKILCIAFTLCSQAPKTGACDFTTVPTVAHPASVQASVRASVRASALA
jgi:hypothetical protein